MLQGQPCDRCVLGAYSLPFLVQSAEKVREELREDALSRCGGCFKVSPAIAAHSGLFRSLPLSKRAWPGQGAKKPGHFVAGLSLAEREGFEPPLPCGKAVFKTAAIDHSATSPEQAAKVVRSARV
jgi:hypothetical protein